MGSYGILCLTVEIYQSPFLIQFGLYKQTQVFGIFFEIPSELTCAILQPLSSCEFVPLFLGMVSEIRDPKSKVVSL